MSLAAVPAFFLARRVVRDGLALLAALIAVAIPSLAYTGTVMTENAFYPLFLVVALVLVLVLERPTRAVGSCCCSRSSGSRSRPACRRSRSRPAVLLAPLVLAVFERRGLARDDLARSAGCTASSPAPPSRVLVVQLASGGRRRTARRLRARRRAVVRRRRGASLPVVARRRALALRPRRSRSRRLIVLVARARSLDARLQAFLAATVALTVCVVPVVATFASEFSDRIEERNMFYVAPLLCIALLAWVERGAPRPRVLAAVAAVVSALLVVAIPFDRFLTTSAITDTLMLLPFWSLQDRIGDGLDRGSRRSALAAGLAAAFLFVPRRYALALPLLVLGLWILAIRPIWWGTHGFERFSRGALFQGIRTADRDWVDQALRTGDAGCVPLDRAHGSAHGEPERVLQPRGRAGLLRRPIRHRAACPRRGCGSIRRPARVTLPDGEPVRDEYLLADSSFEPDGEPIAQRQGLGDHALARRDAARLGGPGRRPVPERHVVRRRGDVPSAALRAGAARRRRSRATRASSSSRRRSSRARTAPSWGGSACRLEGRAVLSVPVRPEPGTSECRVVYTVSPTAVPAEVTGGANPDDRELGAHFNRFVYRPAR